jgi:hypothetical protein
MSKYFNYFPKTFYNNDDTKNSVDVVTNIVSRFSFNKLLKQNSSAFYQYELKDSDTPEIVAHKYYGNAERHWIILLFNEIIDPQFDWPLPYKVLNEYIDSKYSSQEYADTANTSISGLSWSRTNAHSYYKIVQTIVKPEGNINVTNFEIDAETYNQVAESSTTYELANGSFVEEIITKQTKTYYEFEQELNDDKRKINLLKPEFVPEVEREFKKAVKL